MVNKKEENCRLCLRIVRLVEECDYVLLEEIHREILDVLRINLNINKCTQSVICNNCSKNLLESFSFKTVCLYTEDKIAPSISNQNRGNVTLRCKNICRFCMKIIEKLSFSSLKDMGTSNLRMLQRYMPEMDLEAVEDPIICEACFYCLKDYFNFANHCLGTAEKSLIFERIESPNLENSDSNNKSNRICNVFELGNKASSVITKGDNEIAKKKQRKTDCDSAKERKKSKKKNKKQILYKCKKCNFKSLWSSALHTHSLLHKDKADIHMYKCEYCPFETKYKQHIGLHKQQHEDVSFFIAAHKCEICDFRAKTEKSLKLHMINHKKEQSNNFHECNYCSFKTKHATSLNLHMVNHKDVPLLKCPLCIFKTKHRRVLNAHKLTHNKDKTFVCGQCEYRSSQKAYLLLHIRRCHIRPKSGKSYSCDMCAFKTVHKVSLRNHQETHKQPTCTFKCDKCIFESRYKTCVARHTILVHGTSGIQQYKCDSCQFKTKYKSSLTKHLLRVHENENRQLYKCPTCDYKSRYIGTVRQHQLKHVDPSELKTFECYECGFRTTNKTILKNHVVLHMNLFYKCDRCNYQTKHRRNMSGHYRLLHNKKFDFQNLLPVKA